MCVIAISNPDDTAIDSLYFTDDADAECKRLGVNELMFAE